MNSEEARLLLEVMRPGGADESDPRFAEALDQAARDPKLGAWLEAQRRFDRSVAHQLQTVPIPLDLKAAILPERRVVRPRFSLNFWQDWRAGAAMAASLLLLTVVAGLLYSSRPTRFAEFRKALVEESLTEGHLEFKSGDLGQIQRWLNGRGMGPNLTLPAGVKEMRLHGVQIVEAGRYRVPMLCLTDGSKHLHLFIVSGEQLAGLPPGGTPDFEKLRAWRTAAWREGNRTFILAGLKTQAFINKFRKSGRWTMSG